MPKTILFIDDDTMLDTLVTRLLAKRTTEYIVKTAENGQDGIAKARELKPDIIILDIVMPLENGWEVAEKLRADETTRDIPIIIGSGVGSIFDDNPYTEEDLMDSYLKKPYDMDELLAEVEKVLSAKNSG